MQVSTSPPFSFSSHSSHSPSNNISTQSLTSHHSSHAMFPLQFFSFIGCRALIRAAQSQSVSFVPAWRIPILPIHPVPSILVPSSLILLSPKEYNVAKEHVHSPCLSASALQLTFPAVETPPKNDQKSSKQRVGTTRNPVGPANKTR